MGYHEYLAEKNTNLEIENKRLEAELAECRKVNCEQLDYNLDICTKYNDEKKENAQLKSALKSAVEALEQYSHGDDTPAATQALKQIRRLFWF